MWKVVYNVKNMKMSAFVCVRAVCEIERERSAREESSVFLCVIRMLLNPFSRTSLYSFVPLLVLSILSSPGVGCFYLGFLLIIWIRLLEAHELCFHKNIEGRGFLFSLCLFYGLGL
eukprot:15077_3